MKGKRLPRGTSQRSFMLCIVGFLIVSLWLYPILISHIRYGDEGWTWAVDSAMDPFNQQYQRDPVLERRSKTRAGMHDMEKWLVEADVDLDRDLQHYDSFENRKRVKSAILEFQDLVLRVKHFDAMLTRFRHEEKRNGVLEEEHSRLGALMKTYSSAKGNGKADQNATAEKGAGEVETRAEVLKYRNLAVKNLADKMMYWNKYSTGVGRLKPREDIPAAEKKYLVWKVWKGGFNNDRMSFEIAFVWAMLTRRILVLHPKYHMYLTDLSSMADYFVIEDLKRGWPVIEFEEYLHLMGLKLPDNAPRGETTNEAIVDPGNPIWNEIAALDSTVTYDKNFHEMHWCHPSCPNENTTNFVEKEALERFNAWKTWYWKPTQASEIPGLDTAQSFFVPERKMLGNFYRHFWIADRQLQLDVFRAVRDHIHYHPRLFHAAAEIISRLPTRYNSMHVRRGDFQYKEVRNLTPGQILNNTLPVLPTNIPLYIATDEKNPEEVPNPWREHYTSVHTLNDFMDLIKQMDVPKRWYGMLEQLICTQGEIFVGSWLSTFSGYITRLRGYQRKSNFEVYFTSDNLQEIFRIEHAEGIEGKRKGDKLPSWKNDPTGKNLESSSWTREHPEVHDWGALKKK